MPDSLTMSSGSPPPWFDTALLAPDSLTTRSRYPVPEQMTSQTNTQIKFYERGGHVRDKKRFAENKVHRPLSPNPTYGATPPILTSTYPNPTGDQGRQGRRAAEGALPHIPVVSTPTN